MGIFSCRGPWHVATAVMLRDVGAKADVLSSFNALKGAYQAPQVVVMVGGEMVDDYDTVDGDLGVR